MKILFSVAACAALSVAAAAHAQDPSAGPSAHKSFADKEEFSFGKLTPTPEMWFYEQEQRKYLDPKMAVRRRAEFEADQRQLRLAAQRWFGYSNSRPTCNITPFTSTYSASWTSNSPYSGQWRGVTGPTVVVPVISARSAAAYGLW